MKHVVALTIKFVFIAVILEIVLGIMTALSFGQILMISLAVAIAAYIIGNLLVLPVFGNMIASITETGLALLIIYMFNWSGYGVLDLADAVTAAIITGIGALVFSMFFHSFLYPRQSENM